MLVVDLKVVSSFKDKLIMEEFKVWLKEETPKPICQVIWTKTLVGWLKLNVKGSCCGNSRLSGGGDIIIDSNGNMRVAFSEKIEPWTNNSAQLQALLSGVRLCKALGFNNICIESDSTLVVGWL